MLVKRGEIYYADLDPVKGSEQGGIRPVLIIQNDTGNQYSPTVICAAITSRLRKSSIPTHVGVKEPLPMDSVILLEQIRTIDKRRLKGKIGNVEEDVMDRVDKGLSISVGLELKSPNTEKQVSYGTTEISAETERSTAAAPFLR